MSVKIKQERLHQIILGSVMTEKSNFAADQHGQTVFEVLPDSTKAEVAQAVELMFNVKVDEVRTLTTKGKSKMFRNQKGSRNSRKKAYVSLQDGYDIDLGVSGA